MWIWGVVGGNKNTWAGEEWREGGREVARKGGCEGRMGGKWEEDGNKYRNDRRMERRKKETLIEKLNVIIVLYTFQNQYFKIIMHKTFD